MEGGEIIGLSGELGAGKTAFVRGMAEGMGVGRDAWVRSPSFTLINEYLGRLPVYHIDLYRVGSRVELESLNLREYLFAEGVSVIEWFEQLPAGEVDEYLELRIAYREGSKRQLSFIPHGARYDSIVDRLKDSQTFKAARIRG
jgi:tRNA threonylcarbamoyladenosine biosynthesis protein TsaE